MWYYTDNYDGAQFHNFQAIHFQSQSCKSYVMADDDVILLDDDEDFSLEEIKPMKKSVAKRSAMVPAKPAPRLKTVVCILGVLEN